MDSQKKLKQNFMVISLLFQFRKDRMSSFTVMTNNVLANQVPIRCQLQQPIKYARIDLKKETEARSHGNKSAVSIREDRRSSFKVMAANVLANQIPAHN